VRAAGWLLQHTSILAQFLPSLRAIKEKAPKSKFLRSGRLPTSQVGMLRHIFQFRSFILSGHLGINRADTDGVDGSMGFASNLGKVPVRPCKLPSWEPQNLPPSLPFSHFFSTTNLLPASQFPPPTWHEIAFVRSSFREEKVAVCPGGGGGNSSSPETVTWPEATCLELQHFRLTSKSLNWLVVLSCTCHTPIHS
jgi:hypothetical protein